MRLFDQSGSMPTLNRILVVLTAFLFSGLFQGLVSAAPTANPYAEWSDIQKRFFVPSTAQCDAHISLGPNQAIFYSRPANPRAWQLKLSRKPISQAYGAWITPTTKDGPMYTTLDHQADETQEAQIWAALSAGYARAAIRAGDREAFVVLNPGQVVKPTSNWASVEQELLQNAGFTIYQLNAQDTSADPRQHQIFPPPAQGSPPPKE